MEKQPVRVLHVIGQMNYGGAESLVMSLYRNINRSVVQFDFVENTNKEAAYDEEIRSLGGRIYNCPHYNVLNHLEYVGWWKRFFQSHAHKYAVVHGHIGSTAAIYLREAKKHGVFTIAHSHNTNGVGFSGLAYRAFAFPTRFIAEQFFACSRLAGIDRYGKRIGNDPERCIVMRNSIETKRFSYNARLRDVARAQWGITNDEFVVGHIGRFVQQKNHRFLIDIFSELIKLEPKSRLLLVGQEDEKREIRKKVEELGLTSYVIFAGVHKDTAPFYQMMDVFVFPSLFEGFGIVMIEAQTSGLPCVISDRVPSECILEDDLVSICNLSEDAKTWASCVLRKKHITRIDRTVAIVKKGFDSSANAKWLSSFYRAHSRSL